MVVAQDYFAMMYLLRQDSITLTVILLSWNVASRGAEELHRNTKYAQAARYLDALLFPFWSCYSAHAQTDPLTTVYVYYAKPPTLLSQNTHL